MKQRKIVTQWIKQTNKTNKQTSGQSDDERDPGEKTRALHVARAARIFNRPQRSRAWDRLEAILVSRNDPSWLGPSFFRTRLGRSKELAYDNF